MPENCSATGQGTLKEWVWKPVSSWSDNRLSHALRMVLRIMYITLHNAHKDLVMVRAAALTYTVILSVVPLLALGTAVLKGLGAGDQIREAAYTFIANFESSITGEYQPVSKHGEKGSNNKSEQTGASVSDAGENKQAGDADKKPADREYDKAKSGRSNTMLVHLNNAVDQVFDYVDQTNFATIGIIGILGLLVIVIALLDSIEEAINAIWKPVKMRPFGRRFMDYAAMLIIFPIAVNVGFAAIAAIQSQTFLDMAMKWFPFDALFVLILRVFPVFIVIATFTLLYRFLPNTRVETMPAVTGGIVGGLIWLMVQILYLKLQLGVARYNAIYGSFATFPLVLMWIYMGWLAFLTGAEVSYASQVWKRFRIDRRSISPADQMAAALDITAEIFRSFKRGKPADMREIAEQTGLFSADVHDAMMRLKAEHIIREIKEGSSYHNRCLFVPSAPSDALSPAQVMAAVCGYPDTASWGGRLTERGLKGAEEAVSGEKWPEGC